MGSHPTIPGCKDNVKHFNLKGFYSFLPNKAEDLSTGNFVSASAFRMSNEDAIKEASADQIRQKEVLSMAMFELEKKDSAY
ncbi:MAG: hypothetical protein M3Q07_04875 [Pseudobdellovibrionaceae bacterium]|nr:hypothetical protein [Pseudobdellovibrionaceae bacterium]